MDGCLDKHPGEEDCHDDKREPKQNSVQREIVNAVKSDVIDAPTFQHVLPLSLLHFIIAKINAEYQINSIDYKITLYVRAVTSGTAIETATIQIIPVTIRNKNVLRAHKENLKVRIIDKNQQ